MGLRGQVSLGAMNLPENTAYVCDNILSLMSLPGKLYNVLSLGAEYKFVYEDGFGDRHETSVGYHTLCLEEAPDGIVQHLVDWLKEVSIFWRMWGQYPLWVDEPDMIYGDI